MLRKYGNVPSFVKKRIFKGYPFSRPKDEKTINGGNMKRLKPVGGLILAASVLCCSFATACGKGAVPHTHEYAVVAAKPATCETDGNTEYYKCSCGDIVVKSGGEWVKSSLKEVTLDGEHRYSAELAEVEATCAENGVKAHYECENCGELFVKEGNAYKKVKTEDLATAKKNHVFDREKIADKYLLSEATDTTAQTFTYSCVCGAKNESAEAATFTVGKTLAGYETEDKSLYDPSSFTLSLYDAENCVYGFTWAVKTLPARPIVKIAKKGSLSDDSIEFRACYEKANSYAHSSIGNAAIEYYVCKAEIALEANTEYEYVVGDRYIGRFTESVRMKTADPELTAATNWRFAHVSDSQAEGNVKDGGIGTGAAYGEALKCIANDRTNNKFILHTGDVVEYSMYESYWANMLGENFGYFAKMPVMALSGNHETTYKNGSNETYKHFNYKIPSQNTERGFYYSFSYGGVKFIMLNTNETDNKLSAAQYAWLENELKNKTEKWTIVSMHNPMYSVGKWGSDPEKNSLTLAYQSQLKGLFAEYKVDLVLQGHDHMVSRTYPIKADGSAAAETVENGYIVNPDGVIYVMNGPAGDQGKGRTSIYPHDESLYAYAEGSSASSWAEFEVNGDGIKVYVKTANLSGGKILHTWGIKKSA